MGELEPYPPSSLSFTSTCPAEETVGRFCEYLFLCTEYALDRKKGRGSHERLREERHQQLVRPAVCLVYKKLVIRSVASDTVDMKVRTGYKVHTIISHTRNCISSTSLLSDRLNNKWIFQVFVAFVVLACVANAYGEYTLQKNCPSVWNNCRDEQYVRRLRNRTVACEVKVCASVCDVFNDENSSMVVYFAAGYISSGWSGGGGGGGWNSGGGSGWSSGGGGGWNGGGGGGKIIKVITVSGGGGGWPSSGWSSGGGGWPSSGWSSGGSGWNSGWKPSSGWKSGGGGGGWNSGWKSGGGWSGGGGGGGGKFFSLLLYFLLNIRYFSRSIFKTLISIRILSGWW